MLKKLRHKKTAKKIFIGLAVIIIPAFVFWGFSSASRNQKKNAYVGKIFGKNISYAEFQDAVQATKNQARMQFGDKYYEIEKFLNPESQAWDRLMLLYEAKNRKINASDKEVVDLIEGMQIFQQKGKFDEQLYNQIVQHYFYAQPRAFEEYMRQSLILSKLYDEITKEVTLGEEEIKEGYVKENEQVSISYIAATTAEFARNINPTEDEIKEYFTKNSLEFKQPLSFNLEYVKLISEEALKSLTAKLNRKKSLLKAAEEVNLQAQETGYFGQTDPIPGIGWSPQVLSLLPNINTGQLLPTLQLDKYYFVMQLKDKKEPRIPPLEAIKDKVKESLVKNMAQDLAKQKIQECLKKLKEVSKNNPKAADFQSSAKVFGLKSESSELFKFGSYIEGIGNSDDFWLAARKLKDNEYSEIINTPDGFYIIKLKSRVPVDEKNFQAQKEDFTKKTLASKKQEHFSKFVEELKRKAL